MARVPSRRPTQRATTATNRQRRTAPATRTGGRTTRGRTRTPARRGTDVSRRLVLGRTLLVIALVAAGLKLVQVQTLEAAELSARAERQRVVKLDIVAERGPITDRNGNPLAFSVRVKTLSAQPNRITADRTAVGEDPDLRRQAMATHIATVLGDQVVEQELLEKLRSDRTFVYLVNDVEPAKAREITKAFPEIAIEDREMRRYPGGSLAANIIGVANWRADERKLRGLAGLETSRDSLLAGTDGHRRVDTAAGSDAVIPGSERAVVPAVPGSGLELTIDADLQYTLQQLLADHVARTGAKGASAVVLDAHTAEVYALANDSTFDPSDRATFEPETMGNPAVSSPFEPGSVNKLVTVATAIEDGVMAPDTVLEVPPSIRFADRTIRDATPHGTIRLTFTGVLAKSSNVGTLMVARELGPERYAEMLARFGLGARTDVGLPGESAGRVPQLSEWSGSTFGNLPIGQGLSMTVLQMAGMYQAIANDGVRVPPRIVSAEIGPDGRRAETPRPDGVRVVSQQTARTVRDMLRAVVQDAPGQRGTGVPAALAGYQVAGKTGTAQQPDPACGGCYSDSRYWVTFAGMFPANDPRFVVGIMVDAPAGGASAAPLFHDIASYLAHRYQVPLSPEPSPVVQLQLR
jgi:cell division protein FtsI (penicillin-binding protein 3)